MDHIGNLSKSSLNSAFREIKKELNDPYSSFQFVRFGVNSETDFEWDITGAKGFTIENILVAVKTALGEK